MTPPKQVCTCCHCINQATRKQQQKTMEAKQRAFARGESQPGQRRDLES